jgi:hypothetical protein
LPVKIAFLILPPAAMLALDVKPILTALQDSAMMASALHQTALILLLMEMKQMLIAVMVALQNARMARPV